MRTRKESRIGTIALALTLPLALGCGAATTAAAGAAGAAAGIAYTERGAESHVDATPAEVAVAAESALRSLNISISELGGESHEREIEIKGDDGDNDVVVDIEGGRDAGRTHIMVTVSEDVVDYDRDRAEQILRAILARL